MRRKQLDSAFYKLKNSRIGEIKAISYQTFTNLLKLVDPKSSNYKIKILFILLDLDDDKLISIN